MRDLSVFDFIADNLKTLEIDEIVNLLGPLKVGMTVETPVIPAEEFLYRGRLLTDDFRKDSKTKIADLIYPPTEKTKLGRLNRPGKPMFYCASGKEVIFFEVPSLKTGDEFILSTWQTTSKMLVNNIGYTDHMFKKLKANRTCPAWGKPKPAGGDAQEEIIFDQKASKEALKKTRSTDKNYEIRKALSEAFMCDVSEEESYKYKLTTAIGELHLGEIENSPMEFAGVMYPTIRMWGNGDNLALLPGFVDNHVKFKSAFHFRVDDRSGNKISTTKIDSAIEVSEEGTLKWLGRLPNWTLGPGQSTAQFVATVGRDEYGDYSLDEKGNPLYWAVTDFSTGRVIRPT